MNSTEHFVLAALLVVFAKRDAVGAFDFVGAFTAVRRAAAERGVEARFRVYIVIRTGDSTALQLETVLVMLENILRNRLYYI